jgi:sRNA-binding regulator protein Hfq
MRTLTILATVLLVGGCNTAAKIYLKDGRIVEGKIKQSDSHSIYVKSKDSDEVIL